MSFRASRRLRSCLLPLALTLTFASLSTVPLAAQPWRGTAAVALELSQRDRGAAALEVRLQFLDIEPKVGPEALAPGADGRLELGGLAEGKWLLEVKAGGKSAYSAVIQIEAGKKATVVAGPVRDAAAPSVNVKLVKPSGRAAQTPPARPVPTPPAPTQPAPTPSPTTPPPAPRAAPTPAPTPAPTGPPTTAKPSPAPAPTPSAAPTAPPAREVPPPPATPTPSAPAGKPPAASAPVAKPAPAPAAVPPRPTSFAGAPIRSQKDGTCAECKAGEWAVSAQAAAGPQAKPAPCASTADFRAQLQAAAGRFDAGFARYVGPFHDPVTGAWVAATGVPSPPALSAPGAPCQLLALVLPKGARYKGYAYEASEVGRTGACIGDQACEIGSARFLGHPETEKIAEATVIYSVFENTSAERERRAKLIVYFSHPDPGCGIL